MKLGRGLVLTLVGLLPVGLLSGTAALAAEEERPRPWEWWHQPAATPVMDRIEDFHAFLLWIMIGICALVFALLVYVLIRYNARRNPVPSRTAHNTVVEVIWTIVPVLILVGIAIPSFKLLYYADRIENPDMTLKVTGRQWYWDYEYPDYGDFTITSLIVPDEDLKPGQPRLLTVDNRVVLPVDTNIRIQITGGDVIHSWAVPAFGIKMDAVPGRLNETWARVEHEGIFYGQCSELCGVGHAYMPIVVEVVSKDEFAQWIKQAQAEAAGLAPPAAEDSVRLAKSAESGIEGTQE